MEEDDLVNVLRETIGFEKELEAAKIQLILKSDFNVHDAFAIFDITRNQRITPSELIEGLQAIGVYPT